MGEPEFDARLKAGVRNGKTGTPATAPIRSEPGLGRHRSVSELVLSFRLNMAAACLFAGALAIAIQCAEETDMTEATQPDAKKPAQPTPSSQTPDPKTSNEDAERQKRAKAQSEKATNEDG